MYYMTSWGPCGIKHESARPHTRSASACAAAAAQRQRQRSSSLAKSEIPCTCFRGDLLSGVGGGGPHA
eukprot:1498590-Alexandrium_andersonii.AAC.1